ncbi:hypothetical protein [Streptomyces sp. NPDC058297]|uniref:hypothetical protein n=1 Tax=unclassified Streptomyces TaxID=2593676 RepID=UPI0036EDE242
MTTPASANRRPNPFHVLGLPVDATKAHIVERAEEGIQTASTAQDRDLYNWAMRELILNRRDRLRYEVTEPPGTDYRDRRWDAFARAHRTYPEDLGGQNLRPEDFDLPQALRRTVRALATAPVAGTGDALRTTPAAAHAQDEEPELEVRDVLFG